MPWEPGMKCETCKFVTCRCKRCLKCSKRVPTRLLCGRCSKCREHHTVYSPKDFPNRSCTYWDEYDKSTYEINPLRRHLGIELEMSDFGSFRRDTELQNCSYQLVHDGSVSGSGLELVTDKLVGDNYIYGISELVMRLGEAGATPNNSCGFHVHVDAGDFTQLDLRRAMVGFALIQDGLYGTLVDKSRLNDWGKVYCAPLKVDIATVMGLETKSAIVNYFHTWLYGTKIPDRQGFDYKYLSDSEWRTVLRSIDSQLMRLKATKYVNGARRWALNFHSWMMRGTLEFRLKEGTNDPGDILMWPLWCGYFVDTMAKSADKEILYWAKTKPTILEVTQHMESLGMPSYVTNWVKGKLAV